MKKSDQTVLLFENQIFSGSKSQLLNLLSKIVYRPKKPVLIFTPNPEQVILGQKNPEFQRTLQQADVLIPDGIGLVWASGILRTFGRGEAISERITGIDLAISLLEWAVRDQWNVLLLGGRGYHQAGKTSIQLGTESSASGKLRLHWLEGYRNIHQPTKDEEQKVIATIQKIKPQLVFVAFGAPQQERWIMKHLPLLRKNNAKVVMAVGGAFDMLFGKLKRAPWWLRGLGLEWLYRLIQEPSRWRRQLSLIEFGWLTFREALASKKSAKS